MTRYRIRRLERIEGLMHKRGESIPEPSVRHDGPHHEALRQRLSTMRERLERYATLRDTHGIQ
jgi:hypothetical protein